MNFSQGTSVIDLHGAFDGVVEHWSPKVVACFNGQYLKVAKLQGEFVWHRHEHEDELFYVVRGRMRIQYEYGQEVALEPGSVHVVPRGVLHNPIADEECWIVLIEPVTTLHTGDVETERSKSIEQQLA
jgi:mannose-6-phosphate isomerase-like protein (cupin superfamily)